MHKITSEVKYIVCLLYYTLLRIRTSTEKYHIIKYIYICVFLLPKYIYTRVSYVTKRILFKILKVRRAYFNFLNFTHDYSYHTLKIILKFIFLTSSQKVIYIHCVQIFSILSVLNKDLS